MGTMVVVCFIMIILVHMKEKEDLQMKKMNQKKLKNKVTLNSQQEVNKMLLSIQNHQVKEKDLNLLEPLKIMKLVNLNSQKVSKSMLNQTSLTLATVQSPSKKNLIQLVKNNIKHHLLLKLLN